ncbi:MAG: ABC transporter permease [Actinomycetota bacterium]
MVIRPPRWLLAVAVLCAATVMPPLIYLVVRVFGMGWGGAVDLVLTARTWELVARTVALAVVVTVGCLVIGIPTAAIIARVHLPGKGVWAVLAALPLAVPSYVAAYTWIDLFPSISGFFGSAIVLILVSAPYVTLPVLAAFRRSDPALEELARTLGRSSWGALRIALLPQIWPAAAAGALLAGLYAVADFGAVATMRYVSLTVAIHRAYRVGFDPQLAATLALLLTLLAIFFVGIERSARGRWRRRQPGSGEPRTPRKVTIGRWVFLPLVALIAIATLSLGVPALSLVIRLAEASQSSIDWVRWGQAALATIGVSAAGATLAVGLALPIGALTARYRSRVTTSVESLSYLGNAIPGIVIGLSMVYLTLRLVPALYQTVGALAFAYAVMFLPKAVGGVRTAVARVPREWEDVARSLGNGPTRAWLKVTARLSAQGVSMGGLLVMLTAMKELPATLLLRPIGMDTLATTMWSYTSINAYGTAAPYALGIVVMAAIPAYLLGRQDRLA